MIRGEGTETIRGVTPKDVWEFVLDPAQYTRRLQQLIRGIRDGKATYGFLAFTGGGVKELDPKLVEVLTQIVPGAERAEAPILALV